MKKVTVILMLIAAFAGCGQNKKKAADTAAQTTVEAAALPADTTTVHVYYFHGKARCKTCIAVGEVAKKTVETAYIGNGNVQFAEINTSEAANQALAEKYEVTWNALIIAKGENSIEITEQAFATAVENPQALENLIKQEVNNRLQ